MVTIGGGSAGGELHTVIVNDIHLTPARQLSDAPEPGFWRQSRQLSIRKCGFDYILSILKQILIK